jgi:hypothetical protein
MEDCCEYVEEDVTDNRQGVIGSPAEGSDWSGCQFRTQWLQIWMDYFETAQTMENGHEEK